MLNHTYTSVKNANLVNCGKKQHISSQPSPLLKENFLGEFRTELDKKKVLANLGIASSLSLEWEYIKGDIARSEVLMQELDSRTTYTSKITGDIQTLIDGVLWLESVIKGEYDAETEQDNRLQALENSTTELKTNLTNLQQYITDTVDININTLKSKVEEITDKVNNITNLITVSEKEGNALRIEEGDTPGLYVPDLSNSITTITEDLTKVQENVETINTSLESFVTKEDLGGGDFDFVNQSDFDTQVSTINKNFGEIREDLSKTVKTGEDGHVDTLFVNKISKNNDDDNIVITDSFEVESGIPLDVRFVVENLEELCALSYKVCYSGMGVIVNSLSSLYILRKPEDGSKLTQEYVSNIHNWKCPEDLVTVALTREEYEKLAEVNPNVFYYIYEDEFKLTHKPREEEYGNLDDYQNALKDWKEQMKVLDQQYLAASWGLEIEDTLVKKANQTSINALGNSINDLQEQINLIAGGNSDTSLSNLAGRLSETEASLEFLLGTEGTDEEPSTNGKISDIESSISDLNTTLTSQYVTKESITTENDDTVYIFVKKADYIKDTQDRENALKESISTKNVSTQTLESESMSLGNLDLTSDGNDLFINTKEVAILSDVPKMKYLTQAEYNALGPDEIDSDTYYYTTDEEIYITKTEFDDKVAQLNTSISTLQKQITDLLDTIKKLEGRISSLESSNEPEATDEIN